MQGSGEQVWAQTRSKSHTALFHIHNLRLGTFQAAIVPCMAEGGAEAVVHTESCTAEGHTNTRVAPGMLDGDIRRGVVVVDQGKGVCFEDQKARKRRRKRMAVEEPRHKTGRHTGRVHNIEQDTGRRGTGARQGVLVSVSVLVWEVLYVGILSGPRTRSWEVSLNLEQRHFAEC